ncbi:uncharacterized protein C2orf66 homolog [Tachysurus fulvidraco]|uniref:uncharacterized protein C2orf66 homolog n=1 Tax=Tachysurus fulvidraco TaxID=1234273 RepID=UPI001FEEC345|nr:uncharacterized protein C2orf66 homolog [Tachysurus fulvidraco]
MLTVLVLAAVIMVSVESDTSSTEEWKSLSNPKSRMLFFKILQSYLDGREGQTAVDSSLANTALDKYSNFLYNSNYDVE